LESSIEQSLKRRRLLLLLERWRWLEMKVGFWIMDFQVLETEVQLIRDFIGRSERDWIRISGGRSSQSHIDSVCKSSARDLESSARLSDIATSFKERERKRRV
jgi:hypothetical protein